MPKSSADRRHFIVAGVLVVISTILMNWLLNVALPLPVQASEESVTIDRLIGQHLLLISFLFSLIVVFMLYALVVFRKREGDESEGEHFEGNTTLEIAWTVIPLLLVVVFGYIGIVDLRDITREEENELVVKVTAFQWNWRFEYDDGTLSQEMVLPVNRPARMEMTSDDVNHSFWVPEFRVKQDILRGRTTTVRFTPTEVGEYRLRCSELCGLSHWSMLGNVRVVEESEFTAWLNGEELAEVEADPAVAAAEASK